MQHTAVESSNISSIGFENGTLEVRFASGKLYRYTDVPGEVHKEFMDSESKGEFFNSRIRTYFVGSQVEEEQPEKAEAGAA